MGEFELEYGYVSSCCGARVKWSDICMACGEHCDLVSEDEEDE